VARLRPGALLERAGAKGGVEAAARSYRYAAFRRGLGITGARALLLAHTRDDQLETILMRLMGGSGAGGLRGIPEVTGPFMRPFLGLAKETLLAYLEERGLPFSTDSTNASDNYLRNKVRGILVPTLDGAFPGWRKGLSLAAEKAALDEEALSAAADLLAFVPEPGAENELSAPGALLLGAPRAVACRAIVNAAGKLLAKARFSSGMAAAALGALATGSGAVYRGAGIELRERDGRISLRRGLDFPGTGGYFVVIDRPRRVRVGPLEVSASWGTGGQPGIRADSFRFPIVVRSRRPGDAIALKDGNKRLDRLFSEWALRQDARGSAPVVEDRDGIVAVLGAAYGGKDRYRAQPQGERPGGEGERRLSVIVKGA
jgi:tRNA(Ile)-lysidine synthase